VKSLSRNFKSVAAGIVGLLAPVALAHAADKVVIITQSTPQTGNHKVQARFWRRVDNGDWKELDGQRPGIGVVETAETKCDVTVSYKAVAMYGDYTRDVTATEPCNEPQVVFDDFVPTQIASTLDLNQLTNSDAWTAALGNGDLAAAKGQKFAASFQSALIKGDYGVVAIASSELSAQLRAAGKDKEADAFGTLSIQATLNGIAQSKQLDPNLLTGLTFKQKDGAVVLSQDAKSVLEGYQNDLGLSDTSSGFGKTGWATMRSLNGGDLTSASEWKLSTKAVSEFDVSKFTADKQM
jgi:hypothetical protein